MDRRAYLLSADYEGKENAVVMKFYDVERDEVFLVRDKTGHKPYLVTDALLKDLEGVIGPELMARVHSVERIKKFDILRDKEVELTKVEAMDPLAIGGHPRSIRSALENSGYRAWEARIRYYNSYIQDVGLKPGLLYRLKGDGALVEVGGVSQGEEEILQLFSHDAEAKLRIINDLVPLFQQPAPDLRSLALDIEVASPSGQMARPGEARWPIIAISLAGSDGVKKVHLLRRGPQPRTGRTIDGVSILVHEREDEMIRQVLNEIKSYPLLFTFNGDDFDLPYVVGRAKMLGVDHEIMKTERNKVLIRTGIHIDIYKLYRNASIRVYVFGNKYIGHTLDEVSEALLGEKKIQVDKMKISELSADELAGYAFQDAYLTLRLGTIENNFLIRLLFIFSRLSKLPIEDTARYGISTWISNMILHEYRRRGWLMPNQEEIQELRGEKIYSKAVIDGKKYKGAIVLEPAPGVYFGAEVLDFASMYPSIIAKWRISFETMNCAHPECREHKPSEELPHWVCTREIGIIPELIDAIKDLRVRWYKKAAKDPSLPIQEREWYDAVQKGLKVLLVASYGVFGFENFPLYSPPAAEMITALGRKAILTSIREADEMGLDVIYGDTDSMFLKKAPAGVLRELCSRVQGKFGIELEVDKLYRYVVLSRLKKNYLGVLEDGSLDIKGLMGKKRNIPLFVRRAFADVIEILKEIRSEEDLEGAKNRIVEEMRQWWNRLTSGQFKLEEVAFEVMLSKSTSSYNKTTPQHVKAAKMLEGTKHIQVPAGSVISFIKTRDKVGVKPLELASKGDLDIEKYADIMKTVFGQLLDALGVAFQEALTGVKSRTLDSYF